MRGETLAIVGASGSGKSTLLHLLGGLEAPTARHGAALRPRLRQPERRPSRANGATATSASSTSSITCCPSSRALDNVAMPLRIRRIARAPRRASARPRRWQQVGLGERLAHRPAQLSGGERQRVAIARALAGEPDCVLADEPTGNLDRVTADGVFQLLLDLAEKRGMALVLVTHDETLAARCSRRLRLVQGKLAD